MKLKRGVLAPAMVASVALISGGWLLQQGGGEQSSVYQQARLFDEVLQNVSERYVDEHPDSELYEMAINGFLRELGDPHTSFMSAEEYNNLRIQTSGEYGGLGIQIAERDGWVTVIAPLPGTPAERAGVKAGDRIIAVEGQSTEGWTADDAVKVLRGPRGAPANIRVARIGVDEPIDYRIVRDEIHVRSVPYAFLLDDGIGYTRLNLFSETSTQELQQAIAGLRQKGANRLILDLRENPGGLLDQGVSVADLFLERGDAIVETRARDPRQNQVFRDVRGEAATDPTIVVLVDEYSASAAEIVAGALQDHDRALVVGTPTFGKGSVQTLLPLSGGNFLKMTTGKWYTPSGRSIQKEISRDEGETALVESAPIAEDGTPLETADSINLRDRETFRTDAGRTVYGGGGIVPDLIVRPDTFTTAEKEFFEAASKTGSEFNDVLFRYAIDYARANPNLRPDFGVTPAMRQEFVSRLRTAGVQLESTLVAGAQDFIDQRLVYEIAKQKFGDSVAARRNLASDNVVRSAVELLRRHPNQQALFRAVQQSQAGVATR